VTYFERYFSSPYVGRNCVIGSKDFFGGVEEESLKVGHSARDSLTLRF
jgi:hypothetical protein